MSNKSNRIIGSWMIICRDSENRIIDKQCAENAVADDGVNKNVDVLLSPDIIYPEWYAGNRKLTVKEMDAHRNSEH